MTKTFITTAIDYINAKPHLGHVYEKIGADVAARYQKLRGQEPYLLIGADEHSLNIYRNAQEKGISAQQFCDDIVIYFCELYQNIQVDYSRFIRTTESEHEQVVKMVVEQLWEKGYIHRGVYAGNYCESCEAFIDDSELMNGKCPYHPTKDVVWVEEENFFFALSQFQERLLQLYRENPDFLKPDTWRNEIVNRLQAGLKDISISRESVNWGIAFPQKPEHVVYVWFDALLNYLTGSGFHFAEALFSETWPPQLQIIGKDITWFHGIIWPAILMALDLPLPKQIFAHGHLLHNGQKLSKSAGIVIDPVQLIKTFGVDYLRYYLIKAIPWGLDGNFSYEGLVTTCNNDLANDYGNLISRITAMIEKFCGGIIPEMGEYTSEELAVKESVTQTLLRYDQAMNKLEYTAAVDAVLELIRKANKYIEITAPWELAKYESKRSRLGTVLYQLTEVIRISTLLFEPFLPAIRIKVWEQLGLENISNSVDRVEWGYQYQSVKINRGKPLFPRIDLKKVLNKPV